MRVFVLMFDLWLGAGIFYLLWLAIMDFRGNMRVDARPNYIMVGWSLALLTGADLLIWVKLLILASSVLLMFAMKKLLKDGLGSADRVAISWTWLGFASLSPWMAVSYVLILISSLAGYVFVLKVCKIKNAPFFPIIFIGFLLTASFYSWHF